MATQDLFRTLPSVDKILAETSIQENPFIQEIKLKIIQQVIQEARAKIQKTGQSIHHDQIVEGVLSALKALDGQKIHRVYNGTGVVLHTNLGRSPFGKELLDDMAEFLPGYCSLEFDIKKGARGSRTQALENLWSHLSGAEGAVFVNNNAAATMMILQTFAQGKKVVISRGELVQIGGGYRIPDILEASGATLKEVGTTNMTSARDFERALTDETSLVMKVHQSNFSMQGHVESPSLNELIQIARNKNVMSVYDLGSGMLGNKQYVIDPEPTIQDAVRSGCDLVCFSGDKLLGGPQAGIILGSKFLIEKLKKSPLYRALRLGKTEIFLLEQVTRRFAQGEIPENLKMISMSYEVLEKRSQEVILKIGKNPANLMIKKGHSAVGGGTLPDFQITTPIIHFENIDGDVLAKNLRKKSPAVILRVENKKAMLDLRTILPSEEDNMVSILKEELS